jgi:hypothetical protein
LNFFNFRIQSIKTKSLKNLNDMPIRYLTAEASQINLEIVIDPYINKQSKLSRSEFLDRIWNVKGIRTKEIWIGFYLNDIKKLKQLESLHKIVNTGNFDDHSFTNYHLFAIGVPKKLFSWLKNINSSTLHKQILHWHAAYYAFNSFQEFADDEFDPLVYAEVMQILNQYYPKDYKEKFNLDNIEDEKEYELKKKAALEQYFSVSKKYTGSLPPEFLKNPYRDPDSNIPDDDYDWGLLPNCKFCISISYFNTLDWIIIVERSREKLKEFHKYSLQIKSMTMKDIDNIIAKADEDTLQRAESDNDMWQKWKHTFENFEMRKTFTYSLIPIEKIINGFIYLFQTESKEATKIGWTTKPTEMRKSVLQTGNHERIVERGYFAASGKKTEEVLHKLFADKQIRSGGEWFYLTESDIQNILDEEWRMKNNIF